METADLGRSLAWKFAPVGGVYGTVLLDGFIFPQMSISRYVLSFHHGSAGRESTCNAGDPSSIPGLGRSTEKGIGYPRQYSWASLVAQTVKNLPATWETWV